MIKRLVTVLALFLSLLNVAYAQKEDGTFISNKDILELKAANISDAIIINKIQSSDCRFSLSTDDIIDLKKHQISDAVVNAMLDKEKNASQLANTLQMMKQVHQEYGGGDDGISLSDVHSPYDTLNEGLYVQEKDEGFTAIPQTSFTVRQSNSLLHNTVSGFINTTSKLKLKGATSGFGIKNDNPHFLLVVNPDNAVLGSDGAYSGIITSPADLVLVKFNVKNKSREIITGKSNVVSSSEGFDDKDVVPLRYVSKGKGIYEITLSDPLQAGEYGFMFNTTFLMQKRVFAFSVK